MKKKHLLLKVLLVSSCALLLSACLGGLLVQATTQVMLAILKPMVGLDPNSNGLFQQPIIKNRMQSFLGDYYDPTMQLLRTADKVQEEGPLYYVVSRYTPIPQIAEKAGFVWNSDTNQMAVMLISGGSTTVIAERLVQQQANQQMAKVVPQWPAELQTYLDQDALKKKATDAATKAITQKASETIHQNAEAQLNEALKAHEASQAQEAVPPPSSP
ncbi:MAG TPA: hypothetical protein PKK14_09740 [Pseudomonadales bacterium]|nr:hypothetical protein [Pseudomonadales bacterium]